MLGLLNILLLAATSSIFLRIGKYLDFRLGPQFIANLKKRNRLEKFWLAVANQSMDRLANRVLQFVESTFSHFFGPSPVAFKGLLRFTGFSVGLNLVLAFSAIVLAVPTSKLFDYLYGGTLPAITALLVIINIPLDLVAYFLTRYAVRLAMRQPLYRVFLLLTSAAITSYLFAVLSTVIGGVLTMLKLVDIETAVSVIPKLIIHWIPITAGKPFTSQVMLNGANVGYLAAGALPSITVLLATLVFMLLLRTFAKFIHHEFCMHLGRLLDDKKSFFEGIALIFSALIFVLWGILWLLYQLLHGIRL